MGCGDEPTFSNLDEMRGTIDGVGLDDPETTVFERFGSVERDGRYSAPVEPRNAGRPVYGPGTVDGPRRGGQGGALLRYSDGVFASDARRRVYYMLFTSRGLKTSRGVGIGNRLAKVKSVYGDIARCGRRNVDSGYTAYEFCRVRLSATRWLWFGGDPVRSVALSTVAMG